MRATKVNFNQFKFVLGDLEQVVSGHLGNSNFKGTPIHLVNAFTLYCASRDRNLRNILMTDVLLIDGKPLFKYLNLKNKEIVHFRGPDLMRDSLELTNRNQRHYFLGGTEESLKKLVTESEKKFPNCIICGCLAPPYSDELLKQIDQIANEINLSRPTDVWVSLGTPKQDYFIHELAKLVPARIYAVGAAFDFISEKVIEAPPWIRVLYLEWLFRFTQEPKRLAPRYLLGNSYFILTIFKDWFYSRKNIKLS